MSDPKKPTPSGPAPGTHCEWCGVEYTEATRRSVPPPSTPRPPETAGTEPTTHCEWCGAEYPQPGSGR